jgi:hypothetical protein
VGDFLNKIEIYKAVSDIYEPVAFNSIKAEDNSTGDWKVIKSDLKNGDFQIVVYRRVTEINLVCSQLSKNKIEIFFKVNRYFDPFLFEIISEFINENNLPPLENEGYSNTTLFFSDLVDLNRFVSRFLNRKQ